MSVQIFTEGAAVTSMRAPSAAARPTTLLDDMDARALERIGTRMTVPRDHAIFFEEDPATPSIRL